MSKTNRVNKLAVANARFTSAILPTMLLIAVGVGPGMAQPSITGTAPNAVSREEIYVLRSLRGERVSKSNWCTPERTGSTPTSGGFMVEDRYTMWSVAVRPQDGRISDAKAGLVGELHACFGSTADPKVISFYTDGRIAGITFTGKGDCLRERLDFPEKGINTVRCYLNLADLPAPYVGGSLTTNTINSNAVLGVESDPPGYVQASIATIRLWRSH